MALSTEQKEQICSLLRRTLGKKLEKYSRESKSMPFLLKLLQDKEQIAAYSFIHSIATTLGMSLYEQISVILAEPYVEECNRNVKVGGTLSENQIVVISSIVNGLREKIRKPSIELETKEVLGAPSVNGKFKKDGNVADFFMRKNEVEFYFEIKTVKPNIDVFTDSKTKLLEWIARKQKEIKVFLAFPYNPYAPEPYSRFTEQNMMDHPNDFLIAEEYWDFLGGEGAYSDLLELFDVIGKEFKEKIQAKIREVAEQKIEVRQNI